MTIELTEPQQRALDSGNGALCVIDPRTNAQFVLVPAQEFAALQELFDDDRQQRSIRRVGLRNAASRMGEEP